MDRLRELCAELVYRHQHPQPVTGTATRVVSYEQYIAEFRAEIDAEFPDEPTNETAD